MGMGIPRETIQLVGKPGSPKLVEPISNTDYTEQMKCWSKQRVNQLEGLNLHGFILKRNSPNCGLFRVRVYDEKTQIPSRNGRGIFAQILSDRMFSLPVEEEGRLKDLPLRENFIEKIFIYRRWQTMFETNPSPRGLLDFHRSHKMTFISHSPHHYRELGHLVAEAEIIKWKDLTAKYSHTMMEGLSILTTSRKHSKVMHRLMGFLKDYLTPADKTELLDTITQHRKGLIPLIVPLTLLKHHLSCHAIPDWVHLQTYLNPYPKELMLWNQV